MDSADKEKKNSFEPDEYAARRKHRLARLDILSSLARFGTASEPAIPKNFPVPVAPSLGLETALRELDLRKTEGKNRSAAMAAELEKQYALQATLDALPQHERRQVLDAMGLQHISAAPPPITPLRGNCIHGPIRLVQSAARELADTSATPQAILVEKKLSWQELTQEDDVARQDPIYQKKYTRAWELHAELEKWEAMEHQNDPLKENEIELRLGAIRAELAELNKPVPVVTGDLVPAATYETQPASKCTPGENLAPVSRFAAQECWIMSALKERNIDPLALPSPGKGKPGIKAELRTSSQARPKIFSSINVFDEAWKRMRRSGDLKE